MSLVNNIKVFILMAGLTALFVAIGGALGGGGGATIALVIAAAMNLFMYFTSAKMVLRMYKARVVSPTDAPELYTMIDRLRQQANLPMPTVAIAPQAQPNAFATGRNPEHAVVCFTEGILQSLSREELEGVAAHELAHIKNRDMLLQTVTATLAGAITNLAHFGFLFGHRDDDGNSNPIVGLAMLILAPLAASLLQMAISRSREFKADAVGAEICGKPLALASALNTLERGSRQIPMDVSPAAASLAIVNPLSALGGMTKLFSTHPPTAERVARLQAIASGR